LIGVGSTSIIGWCLLSLSNLVAMACIGRWGSTVIEIEVTLSRFSISRVTSDFLVDFFRLRVLQRAIPFYCPFILPDRC
jgi:hypothetical protein